MRVAITGFAASWNASTSQDALAAMENQLREAKLWSSSGRKWHLDAARVALIYGSSKGDLDHLAAENAFDWASWPDRFALQLAASLGICGPLMAPVAACATGAHAIALGKLWLEYGRADVVIAGAIEPPQPEIVLAAYRNLGALSKRGAMVPFDTRRDGFVPGSGHGFLLLEREESARSRGAQIHAFLSGTSMKCDATHLTSMQPDGQTIARAITDALDKAGNPRISYINAHGTATKLGDSIEARALMSVFGSRVPVSSTKAMTGHLMGASGAVEAAICLRAMQQNFAPPTLNLEKADAEMNLDFVTGAGREVEMSAVLSLSYGFGGHIGALVFEKN